MGLSTIIDGITAGQSLVSSFNEAIKLMGIAAIVLILVVGLLFFLPIIIASMRQIKLRVPLYLPCLTLPEQKSIGKWGQKYRAYLRNHKREVYNAFQSDGILDEHIAEIDQQAEKMFDQLVEQIATRYGITEQLKADDQMAWVSAMNHVRSIAEEAVLSDLIYC